MDHPIIGKLRLRRPTAPPLPEAVAAGPFREVRWAAWRASVVTVARHAAQRASFPEPARTATDGHERCRSFVLGMQRS